MGCSRREWLQRYAPERADAYEVDAGPLRWLVDLMHDAGPVIREHTMAGTRVRGLRWVEIAAWIEGAGMQDLRPFWRRQVKALSAHYAEQIEASSAIECQPPYQPEDDK
ncbi:hypothetical protein PMES_02590 [Profundibacterium mesophilum KAUST100406-0324]|uniref:Uncharacterized protein n=2 Tax=Profundibacterium TaxID=1258570 RepID=A0A921NUL1_9RHOB|nr:hypothetical protein PMES_02590 [Profundibacterium mesophilum KAUST100406-0324]